MRRVTYDLADPNQALLYWALLIVSGLLGLIFTFLFCYWIIRLSVYHGMREYRRWERSGEE